MQRAMFFGLDDVYHNKQSREGKVGSVLDEKPYSGGDGTYVYFAPDDWSGSVAITRLDNLVLL